MEHVELVRYDGYKEVDLCTGNGSKSLTPLFNHSPLPIIDHNIPQFTSLHTIFENPTCPITSILKF
nr:hypothetical protein Itr_chr11CG09470 [Ipomoea trifida]